MTDNLAWLEQRLHGDGGPLIIDGGMGTELQKSGVPMDDKLWSGRAVLTHADAVREAHMAFIGAGAEVIIANTFASARHMLESGGLGNRVEEINTTAVRLARQAREQAAEGPVAIAGSICEWAPFDDGKWIAAAIADSAREQADILAAAGVDLIALEMCEQIDLSLAAIDAARQAGLPLWIGLSARRHERKSSLAVFDYPQLDFAELAQALGSCPAMMMNIMHTPIIDVDAALAVLRQSWEGPVGIYPESGYFKMPHWQFVDIIEPSQLPPLAQGWVDQGVRMLGGCCGLGPAHIAALREAFS